MPHAERVKMSNRSPIIKWSVYVRENKLTLSSVVGTLSLLACVTLFPLQALAQSSDQDRFSELVVEARNAYEKEDYELAIERLQQANMLIPDDRVMFNIGTSYEKLGDCKRALAYFEASLRAPNPSEGWPDKIGEKIRESKKDCPDYESSAVTGRISLTSTPSRARVYIDGKPLGRTPYEVIMLPEGRHKFQIKLDGYKPISETVVLSSQADLKLEYKLEEVPEIDGGDPFAGDTGKEGSGPSDTVEDPSPKLNVPALAMTGLGTVGLGVGAYINWFRLCPAERCYYVKERRKYSPGSPEWDELTAQRQTSVVLMAATTTVGVLLVAGGATWFILDRKKQKDELGSTFMLTPSISREGAGVGMTLTF